MASIRDRFFGKVSVDPRSGCWLWTGHINTENGYGQFWDGERVRGAHQVSYELFKGPIPEGCEPDHTCRVRHCVCPDHLEAITHRENLLRGNTIPARKSAQTECESGHPLSGDNLYRAKNGTRQCRECRRVLNRRWTEANRERRRELDRVSYRRRRAAKQQGETST